MGFDNWRFRSFVQYIYFSNFENIYYSNFDKHHCKDFHRAQCTQLTHLALDNFRRFSSNLTRFSLVIQNAVGYSFVRKSRTRRSHGCPLVEKMQNVIFEIPSQKSVYFSYLKRSDVKCVSETHFQPFNNRLKSVCK